MTTIDLTEAHRRRLKDVWRSAGWPCQDTIEAELLAGGWLVRRWDDQQRFTVHLTDLGLQVIASTARRNRERLSMHEQLVQRVALHQHREGRIVWQGLSLLTSLSAAANDGSTTLRWVMSMPDVFSIRHTSKAEYLEPMSHEVKVQRSDLLSDLRQPDKARAYLQAAGRCWYVIKEGIGEPEEIPEEFGVMVAQGDRLQVARAAPRLHGTLPFATWIALAKAAPVRFEPQAVFLGSGSQDEDSALYEAR